MEEKCGSTAMIDLLWLLNSHAKTQVAYPAALFWHLFQEKTAGQGPRLDGAKSFEVRASGGGSLHHQSTATPSVRNDEIGKRALKTLPWCQ